MLNHLTRLAQRLLGLGTDEEFEAALKSGLIHGYRDGLGVWHEPISEAEADKRIAAAKYYREQSDWGRVT